MYQRAQIMIHAGASQGGPHNHTITALAVALKMAKEPEFLEYQQQATDDGPLSTPPLHPKQYYPNFHDRKARTSMT